MAYAVRITSASDGTVTLIQQGRKIGAAEAPILYMAHGLGICAISTEEIFVMNGLTFGSLWRMSETGLRNCINLAAKTKVPHMDLIIFSGERWSFPF